MLWRAASLADVTPDSLSILQLIRPAPGTAPQDHFLGHINNVLGWKAARRFSQSMFEISFSLCLLGDTIMWYVLPFDVCPVC